jgi:Fur family ferric uptake transcriptional regulator
VHRFAPSSFQAFAGLPKGEAFLTEKNSSLEGARLQLRAAGLRATPARLAVLGMLDANSQPATHQELSEALSGTGVDKSTVFRALNDLTNVGLIRRLELGDHVWRYERMPTSQEGVKEAAHPHLLCVDCGKITCLTRNDIEINISQSIGQVSDILLKGHCPDCTDVK